MFLKKKELCCVDCLIRKNFLFERRILRILNTGLAKMLIFSVKMAIFLLGMNFAFEKV